MEATIAVLRLKRTAHSNCTFDSREDYDVLLTSDTELLPTTAVPAHQEHSLISYIYERTGLKGSRVISIPQQDNLPDSRLYCIPIPRNEKMNVEADYRWMNCIQPCPGDKLTLHRLKILIRSVTNPAYFFSSKAASSTNSDISSLYANGVVNVAVQRMLALDTCELLITNPLYQDQLTYDTRVDKHVVNKYFGMGTPNYANIKTNADYEYDPSDKRTPKWKDEYPLHSYAYEGDTRAVRKMMLRGHSTLRKDEASWLPIHYAAWYGHVECVQTLLTEGNCSPSLTTQADSTVLHLAARKGRVEVVQLLLSHPNININTKDCNNSTPLNICDRMISSENHRIIEKLLNNVSVDSPEMIRVYLMDGSHCTLTLDYGVDTTVQQLRMQMLQVLGIDELHGSIFTIWICSNSLDLQLKRDHRVTQHLSEWQRRTIVDLTDADPDSEPPRLVWRRDATRTIADDRRVRDPLAVRLLYGEASTNVLGATYPCSDADAVRMAAVVLRLRCGGGNGGADYDCRRAKAFLAQKDCLLEILPAVKVNAKGGRYQQKILEAYKLYINENTNKSDMEMHIDYLTVCWNLVVYGAAVFRGHMQNRHNTRNFEAVKILVNDVGIHIISCVSEIMVHSLKYEKMEWTYINNGNCPAFEMRSKIIIVILSRQAQLINYLADKYSQMNIFT